LIGGRSLRRAAGASALFLLVWALAPVSASAGRLSDIRSRGYLVCGIFPEVAGFATVDPQGNYSGFDIDICRAVAAAIFGRPDQLRFEIASDIHVLARSPQIDLVLRRLTWTMGREAETGLMFGPIVFYDGQGFMALKSLDLRQPRDLSGKRVCVEDGEDWAGNLARYSRDRHLGFQLLVSATRKDAENRFYGGACDAYSADVSMLAAIRRAAPHPDDYAILDQQISKEPLAPLLRQGDDQFFEIVRWTIFVLIDAEELGITSGNAAELRQSSGLDAQLLLRNGSGPGHALGLGDDWAFDVVRSVGNYGEIYERNLGAASPIRLARGLNKLWTQGGLLYAPPVR
jgi:general L-amino acid transport system substrate-binding protein